MRSTWTWMALAAVIGTTGALAPVVAGAQNPGEVRVDLNLKDAPMKAAIESLMRSTGIAVVFEATDQPYPMVSLSLPNITAEEGLRYICESAGVFFRRDANGVYIISRNRPGEKAPVADPMVPVKRKLYRVKLQHADPQEVYDRLMGRYEFRPGQELMALRDYMSAVNNKTVPVGQQSRPTIAEFGPEFYKPRKHGYADPFDG